LFSALSPAFGCATLLRMIEPEGDPACWLDRICEECGGILAAGQEHRCDGRRPREAAADRESDT
jgi:hypothetical protein